MKKINLLFLSLSIFAPIWLYAQEAAIALSQQFQVEKEEHPPGFLAADESGVYVYHLMLEEKKNLRVLLKHFDHSLKLLSSKVVTSPYGERKSLRNIKMVSLGDGFAWLSESRNAKSDAYEYHIVPVSKNGKAGTPVLANSIPFKNNREEHPDFDLYLSDDRSKLLFVGTRILMDTKDPMEYYLAVFDKDGKRLWQKDIKMPLAEKQMETISWLVTGQGDALLLADVFQADDVSNRKKEFKKKTAPGKNALYYFSKNKTGPTEFPLAPDGLTLKGCSLFQENENNLLCAGFYSKTYGGKLAGAIQLKISLPDGKATTIDKKVFSAKELASLDQDAKKSTTTVGGKQYIGTIYAFNRCITNPDGSKYWMAEKADIVLAAFKDSFGNPYYQTLNYRGDLFVFPTKPDGTFSGLEVFSKQLYCYETSPLKAAVGIAGFPRAWTGYRESEPLYTVLPNDGKPAFVYDGYREDFAPGSKSATGVPVLGTFGKNNTASSKAILALESKGLYLDPKENGLFGNDQLYFLSFKQKEKGVLEYHLGSLKMGKVK